MPVPEMNDVDMVVRRIAVYKSSPQSQRFRNVYLLSISATRFNLHKHLSLSLAITHNVSDFLLKNEYALNPSTEMLLLILSREDAHKIIGGGSFRFS